ncbi:LysR family transcriptional regulator, repressor for citA [Eubacterium ruminantium]|nr:LysR family transcriptional regulator, repressor for citA [Eubacterium ruminantium]
MDTESIKTFLVLSKTRNYTRTADQLFVAQSTVTNRINELEKELKFKLFKRNNRSVELTSEGERFRVYAEQMIELTENSLAEISSVEKYDNYLRIGSADSIYEAHLARRILEHKMTHPKDFLRISIGLSEHLLEQVQNDMLDVVFTYLPIRKNSLHCELYKQDTLVLVTRIENEKYKDGITEAQLLQEKYLMCNFALQDVGQYIRKLFPKYHQFELEIDDCMKIVPFLLNQDNYTFLPKDMAEHYFARGRLREVPLIDFNTPVINSYIIFRKSHEKICREIFCFS